MDMVMHYVQECTARAGQNFPPNRKGVGNVIKVWLLNRRMERRNRGGGISAFGGTSWIIGSKNKS